VTKVINMLKNPDFNVRELSRVIARRSFFGVQDSVDVTFASLRAAFSAENGARGDTRVGIANAAKHRRHRSGCKFSVEKKQNIGKIMDSFVGHSFGGAHRR
jgi:hypothetical protein